MPWPDNVAYVAYRLTLAGCALYIAGVGIYHTILAALGLDGVTDAPDK